MKKIISIAAALFILLAMAAPAFAADPTISAPENGHTYDIFQLFTGDYSDGKLTNIKYGANAKGGTVGASVPTATLEAIAALNGSDAENAKAIAATYANLTTAFKSVDSSAAVSVPVGYYLVKDQKSYDGKDDASTLYLIKVVSGNITLSPKAGTTTLTKTIVDAQGAELGKGIEAKPGDKIFFKIEVTLSQKIKDYDKYKVIITDTLSADLEYNNDAVIKDGAATVTGKFAKTANALEWTCADVNEFAQPGDTIVLTYTATLKGTTLAANSNSAVCKYSNNPHNAAELGQTPASVVKIYNFSIVINKVDGSGEPLTGANFKLSKRNADDDGWNVVSEITATNISTFTWNGLVSGKYMLEETFVPAGYNEIDPIEFTITATINEDGSLEKYECSNDSFTPDASKGTVTAEIENVAGSILPTTGGIGTKIFYIVGGALVLGAIIYIVSRRKVEGVQA